MWVIPELTDTFIERMLDVLEVYERAYDPHRPAICVDEKSVQLREDARPEHLQSPGKVRKRESEYIRHGTANVFIGIEPLGKKRVVKTTKRRAGTDFAKYMKDLIEKHYAEAEKLVIVMDNLNTHSKKWFVETFGAEKGSCLWDKLEVHYTPAHASWLNMAEIEISCLVMECMKKRTYKTIHQLGYHLKHWQRRRNNGKKGISWSFTRKRAAKKFHLNYTQKSLN
jgi:hypothetical protein